MSLVVEDVVKARDNIAQLAVGFGGWVVSSQISGQEQEMRGWISIRVPDDKFEQVMAELGKLAVRVTSEIIPEPKDFLFGLMPSMKDNFRIWVSESKAGWRQAKNSLIR
jgi:hypothetical protein